MHPTFVCKLHKSLYGLKQAPRAWFECLSTTLLTLGFEGSKADSSLFHFHKNNITILILIYVDDVIVTGNNSEAVQAIISTLSTKFSLKDLGSLKYFLGIEINRFQNGLFLSQAKYTRDLLHKARMIACSSIRTPMATKITPSVDDHDLVNATTYRGLVGSLQYLTFTRPDITHAVNRVCQHFQNPTKAYLHAVKRILRYLKGTIDYGIRFLSQSSLTLYGFSDSDWAGYSLTRRSTTGYCIYLGSNCISWSSNKQNNVARSSAEAEYRSMASTTAELTWITFLPKDIGISLQRPPLLLCDNMSALHMTRNPVFHAHTKHIEIDVHFIRERVAKNLLHTKYVPSHLQIANIFTKPLAKIPFTTLRYKLGVHNMPRPNLRWADNKSDIMANNGKLQSIPSQTPIKDPTATTKMLRLDFRSRQTE